MKRSTVDKARENLRLQQVYNVFMRYGMDELFNRWGPISEFRHHTNTKHSGGLAQLGERLAGSQKVRGSSPLSSTWGVVTTPQASPILGFAGLSSFLEEP